MAWVAVAVLATLASACAVAAGAPLALFVNCNSGSDANNGTATSPFLTPNHARDVLRAQPSLPNGAVVTVEGVCVPRDATGAVDYSLPVLSLGPADSGAGPDAPVVWTAGPAGGTLSGGAAIPAGAWKPVRASRARTPRLVRGALRPAGMQVCFCAVCGTTIRLSGAALACVVCNVHVSLAQDSGRSCAGAVVTNISSLVPEVPGGFGNLAPGSLGQVRNAARACCAGRRWTVCLCAWVPSCVAGSVPATTWWSCSGTTPP